MIVTISLVRSPTARRVGTQVVAHRSWTTRTGSPVPRSACERFEPDAWKQARPVLRGRDGGNVVLLPDYLADYGSPREAREGIARYFQFYNTERPHQALGYRRPADLYHA